MKNACCASTKIMTKNLNEENEKPILKNDISFIVLHSITISDDQKTNDAVETVDNKSKE